MAVKDTSRKPYIQDNDTKVKVGIDLPIRRGDRKDGWFASTTTTIEAVKNNIKNLLSTNQGERFMQPNLGLNLREVLFNQIDETTILAIQDKILDVFEVWLPFVEVKDIEIKTNEDDKIVGSSEIRVVIIFNITQDPDTLDSVILNFSSDINDNVNSSLVGGGY